jgi:hypothetical protein
VLYCAAALAPVNPRAPEIVMAKKQTPDIKLEEHFLAKRTGADREIGVASVTGYVGKSDKADRVRVYQDLRFEKYVEVPKKAIIRAVDVPDSELQFGGTRLWVSFDAQVVVKDRKEAPQSMSGEQYFKGAIAETFVAATKDLQYDWIAKREMLMLGSSAKVCFNTCIASARL